MSRASRASTAPPCRHFGTCGGCTLLDVAIERQIEDKRARIRALLAPFLADQDVGLDPPPHLPLHTRTKLSWPIQRDRNRGLLLGMYERGTHRAVEIEECRIQDPALTKLAGRAAEVLRDSGIAPYDETRHEGFLRAFHARLVPGSGELLLGMTTRAGRFDGGTALADALLDAAHGLRDARGRRVRPVGVVRSILDDPGNALLGRRHVPLRGRDYQVDRVAGLSIRVGFGSFYQSHRNAETVLFRPALAMLGDVSGLRVVDAYGGVGTFGLRIARAGAASVVVVEASATACADARENARQNDLPAVSVVESPFADAELEPGPDACVVDPPRKGLSDADLDRLRALRPGRILYVSCGPRALARDLAPLTDAGYAVRAARIADLFPHTEHVEVVCLLSR